MHENYLADEHDAEPASPGKFGLLLGIVLGVVALVPLLNHHPSLKWALAISAVSLLLAAFAPAMLWLPSRAWHALGDLLSKLVAPVALAVVFFGVFTGYGWLLRVFRRNALHLGRDAGKSSYWVARARSDQHPSHFRRQF